MDARSVEVVERELGLRRLEMFVNGALAVVSGALAGAAEGFQPRLVLVFGIGAGCAFALAVVAVVRRRDLIRRVALEREAYVIPAVRRYGFGLTTPRRRKLLARSLRSLSDEAQSAFVVRDRVVAFRRELEELAAAFERCGSEVDPISAVACLCLLTDGGLSPLLNPALPVEDLRSALERIRGGIGCPPSARDRPAGD